MWWCGTRSAEDETKKTEEEDNGVSWLSESWHIDVMRGELQRLVGEIRNDRGDKNTSVNGVEGALVIKMLK